MATEEDQVSEVYGNIGIAVHTSGITDETVAKLRARIDEEISVPLEDWEIDDGKFIEELEVGQNNQMGSVVLIASAEVLLHSKENPEAFLWRSHRLRRRWNSRNDMVSI
ncbi:MAG: hypothetical protein SVM79_06780 [Chloroflexota bacterium]|nr:hypothetical protein [Chloroflexota bacterium]